MPKIRRKSIENDFLLIFFLHAERGCRSIIYFNDFATPSFLAFISCKDYCYIFILSFSSSMVTLDSSSVVPMTFMSTSCSMVGA